MKHLNEKHTWFNLEKNDGCILRYTTDDDSMLNIECINKLKNSDKIVHHSYGLIIFQKPLQKIEAHAFKGSKLKTIHIPDTVRLIDEFAFANCFFLSEIHLSHNLKQIEWNSFSGCHFLNNVVIPDSVLKIAHCAFNNCDVSLTNLVIGSGVEMIDDCAFWGCDNLKDITYKGTKEQFRNIIFGTFPITHGTLIHCTDGVITFL